MRGYLSMWTIYSSPADHPGAWVVRRFRVGPGDAEPVPDIEPWAICPDLDAARDSLPEHAVVCFPRDASDPASIVETWC